MPLYISYTNFLATIKNEIAKRATTNHTNFVLIWGASASGKTTLARQLTSIVDDSSVFSVDSYITASLIKKRFRNEPLGSIPYIEGMDPAIWDLDVMNEDLYKLLSGEAIQLPIYNYTTKTRDGYIPFSPPKTLFIEGAYSMKNSIVNTAIIKILIYANLHDRLIRKMIRTVNINKRNDLDASIERYLTQTNTSLKYYTDLYESQMDYMVYNPLRPTIEFGNLPIQKKLSLSNHYTLLRPKNIYDKTIKDGVLIFYEKDSVLEYTVNGNRIMSSKIKASTYNLLCKYYTCTE